MIQIKNLKAGKPENPWDVKVDRSSVLGNPFYMKSESHRDEVCENYAEWFKANKSPTFYLELKRLCELYKEHGKLNLYCWCAPKRCHAETIRQHLLSSQL